MALLTATDDNIRLPAKQFVSIRTSELMPQGVPQFPQIRNFPMIAGLIKEHGMQTMHKVVFALVKDLCGSLNLVRNMSEDQMIEATAFLLDECGNFRLEDYLIMFSLAKRGQLVKILDRMDMQIIGLMLDEYWERRNAAANRDMQSEGKPPPIPKDAIMADPAKVSQAMKFFLDAQKKAMIEPVTDDEMGEEIRRQQMNMRRRAEWEGKTTNTDTNGTNV